MRLAYLLLLALASLCGAAAASAQEETAAESIRLRSVDGVNLRGRYYAATKPRAACALLLHALGKDSRHQAWDDLAIALQQQGYAVLSFDFRGHGASVEVEPDEFWSSAFPANRTFVKGVRDGQIAYKDFDKRYYPVLANDIAAARAFLDRRNDRGECNSANLILIGADTGATLGALWLNAECHRHRVMVGALGVPLRPAPQSEGQRVLCALWLEINSTLGGRRLNLPALLDASGRQQKIPQVFLYSDGDTAAQSVARSCERALRQGLTLRYTGSTPIAGGAALSGRDLLQQRRTHTAILEYLEAVSSDHGNEWSEQDAENSAYLWRLAGRWTPASVPGSATPMFSTYEQFLR